MVLAILVSGCATRRYVRSEIRAIEPQITEVRDAQAQQAERIDAIDRRAKDGLSAANQATMSAIIAAETASAVGRRAADAERRADAAQQNAKVALNRIDTVETRVENRFANLDKYKVADRQSVTFKFDSDELTRETIGKLDDLAGLVSRDETGYVIELQGFTDAIGTEKYNFALSERRAESVMRYLVSKDIPLYRISIVGLGKTSPVADNQTSGGREQNRRVEVRLLRSSDTVATANR
jgi:outer membrane protein OmpA-like peptidoglycan-associated protein